MYTNFFIRVINTSVYYSDNTPMSLEAIPVSPTSINVTWSLSDIHEVDSFELCYYAIHIINLDGPKCFILYV